jgi:hypothetical protein
MATGKNLTGLTSAFIFDNKTFTLITVWPLNLLCFDSEINKQSPF